MLKLVRLSTLTSSSAMTDWLPTMLTRSSITLLSMRGLAGTYVSVEPFHLFRYLDEQTFRYNNRKNMSDADRFDAVLSQVAGKRLAYAEVTGKVEETIN
jgi:hypothetical protein